MNGTFCHDCGIFLDAKPSKFEERCYDCHEEELHRAANNGDIPDGIKYADWEQVRQKYMEPQEAYRE